MVDAKLKARLPFLLFSRVRVCVFRLFAYKMVDCQRSRNVCCELRRIRKNASCTEETTCLAYCVEEMYGCAGAVWRLYR